GYFTSLQKNDGRGINATGTYPFTNDCRRTENGSLTAGAPPRPNLAANAIDAFAMDCLTQFKLGYYFVVQSIHGRRFPVVDRARRRMGAWRPRSGHGQLGSSLRRAAVYVPGIQSAVQHPIHRGVPD